MSFNFQISYFTEKKKQTHLDSNIELINKIEIMYACNLAHHCDVFEKGTIDIWKLHTIYLLLIVQ